MGLKCPKCKQSDCTHRRSGPYFEHEFRCGRCNHVWEPEFKGIKKKENDMKFVESYGAIYKLTNKKYLDFLEIVADGNKSYSLRKCGAKFICVIDFYCEDLPEDETKQLAKNLRDSYKER